MIKKLEDFVEDLAVTEVTPNVCNQYAYAVEENIIRRNNLLIYLNQMYKLKPWTIFVGEAPGYRGCRSTGVPFTSEHLLMNNIEGLDLFGKAAGYRLASAGDRLVKEATATIIWETLLKNNLLVLAWNAFPFHPYKEGVERSNRTPSRQELILGEKPLLKMIEIFNIKNVVAVGRKAEESLNKLNITNYRVRHPAQGGKKEFVKGIVEIRDRLE
ncbi:uracil-DNA glycosylase [Clostridium formicaceticum]|uniref:Uracil DNA glycosylase superfamily protein n=1 Tax=Clostridium formicaceticum TaxID=1497 RepID=A0AAC9RME5_9CLOT|nr:uracil-DNA glycosylase [Clostridium formicaceticum]AOY77768.1 uracil-DNA glycosylase [Clostridium formicaceticum]ARE88374.1 Uracil DNA glycosylase superfamily protein [Clostridium formicaceticum]